MTKIPTAVVQTAPDENYEANIERALGFVREAAAAGARLISLPEAFVLRTRSKELRKEAIAYTAKNNFPKQLSDLAKELGVYFLAGSYSEAPTEDDAPDEIPGRAFNTTYFFDPNGDVLGKYRKIHMFDVDIAGGVSAKESDNNRPGDDIVTVDTEFGKMGLTICYDVRFPEMYRIHALRGAFLTFVPANFTMFTGKDHWEVLLRARAIENGTYIVAAATIGANTEFNSYGRSMIIDPWGTVIATAPDEEGFVIATVDTERVQKIQSSVPSLKNRVAHTYRWENT